MNDKRSLVRRISPEIDSEIRRMQTAMMGNNNKSLSYTEASKLYALTSFNGKTDLLTAIKRMDRL
jgi:hypothetical protein